MLCYSGHDEESPLVSFTSPIVYRLPVIKAVDSSQNLLGAVLVFALPKSATEGWSLRVVSDTAVILLQNEVTDPCAPQILTPDLHGTGSSYGPG